MRRVFQAQLLWVAISQDLPTASEFPAVTGALLLLWNAATGSDRCPMFVQQEKSVAFPEETFELLCVPAAKQVQAFAVWIQGKRTLDDGRQTVNTLAHVRASGQSSL